MSVLITCPRCNGTGDDPDGGICSVCQGAKTVAADHRTQSAMMHELLVGLQADMVEVKAGLTKIWNKVK